MRLLCNCFFGALIMFLGIIPDTLAQKVSINIHITDSTKINLPFPLTNDLNNSQELAAQIRKIVPQLQKEGYLSSSIDSISIDNSRYDLYLHCGHKYRWAVLEMSSIPSGVLTAAAINPRDYTDRALDPKAFAHLVERLLQYCEENGFPFAKVWLTNVQEKEDYGILASLRIDFEESRRIDTIMINSDTRISEAFIHRYLDIAKGSLYNEKKLKSISRLIKDLAFVQESSPWLINFRPGDTRLSLFLKEKKANQLNAILGLMPNNLKSNKMLVTADVQLALQNYFGHGEFISASFQNLQEKSPRFKSGFIAPYLFKSPLGIEANFDYFRNAFDFQKVTAQFGIRYQMSTQDLIKLYVQSISNRIIEIDTATILQSKRLPANIDFRSKAVGFEFQSSHLDYKLNPHKGWQAKIGLAAVQRKVMTNNTISGLSDATGFNYGTLYDTLAQAIYQYHITVDIASYIPLSPSLTVKIAYLGGGIVAPRLFQNELFQIGGFKLLRGFDEQSIFANQYHVSIAELRLKISQNSFAYLFSDNGWLETKFSNYNKSGWYNGFGLGTTLETKTGLFSIALAFGRNKEQALKFRESKLSFGYIALF